MNIFSAIILGVVQGFTEFLPVSSSAHLVIAEKILHFENHGILFEVVLHAGTILAVLYFFRRELIKLALENSRQLFFGTIPAVIVGFVFKDVFVALFSDVKLVGVTLIVTGAINYLTDRFQGNIEKISLPSSLLIGVAQAIAIIPGISRSGSTIFAARGLKISPKKAAQFSFLLSVPAVVGANVLELKEAGFYFAQPHVYLVGFVVALFTGVIAIRLVMNSLSERKFKIFGVYCAIVGVIALLFLG